MRVCLGGPWPVEVRSLHGDAASDYLGRAVSGAGDVDADAFDDVIVGAYGDDNRGTDSGSARVVSGASGLTIHAWDGIAAGDAFGFSVSGAGDVDRDGYADLIVGSVATTGSQIARVFSGRSGSNLYEFPMISGTGLAVAGAGDVNGDGVQLIATTNPAGMAVSTLVVPNDPALLGIALALQWLVVDPNATHGIPVALSDGLRAVFGR